MEVEVRTPSCHWTLGSVGRELKVGAQCLSLVKVKVWLTVDGYTH